MSEKQIEDKIPSAIMNIARSMGPFHPDPKINDAYIELRIAGVPEKETKELLNGIIERLNTPHKH